MSILDLLRLKEEIANEIPREKRIKDEHAKRAPIRCGLTVHPGYGCSLGCLYCYIYDMGLGRPIPSNLSGESFLYSLACNPYFLPQKTFLAIGSITEPFLPEIMRKTLEFSREIAKLGNPVQISTKLPNVGAERLLEILPNISFLVSISDSRGDLEPLAPPPKIRASIASSLSERGYNVYIFLRPIIPGYTDKDLELLKILEECEVKGVVLGGMRVTKRTLNTLSKKINVNEIIKRLPRIPSGREQVPLKEGDIKERILEELKEIGIRTFPLACAATADSYSLGCLLCKNRCEGKMERLNEFDIKEFLESFGREVEVKIKPGKIMILGKIGRVERELLKAYYRVKVVETRISRARITFKRAQSKISSVLY